MFIFFCKTENAVPVLQDIIQYGHDVVKNRHNEYTCVSICLINDLIPTIDTWSYVSVLKVCTFLYNNTDSCHVSFWDRRNSKNLDNFDTKYRKNSKIWDTSNNCHNCPKNRKVWCNIALMHPKDADGMANSVDPDQTASSEAVWSWSALFAETYLSQYIEFVR